MIAASGAIPVSIAPGGTPPTSHSCVWIDDEAATAEMTSWLIGMGHRRIAFITGDPEHDVIAGAPAFGQMHGITG
ncbi:hypothetical protein LTR94_036693, partial [Friedmanniomyces endolithicus]